MSEAQSEPQKVLYLSVKRPDPAFKHKWRGGELLELHTNEKAKNMIEKYRSERLFVRVASRRDIICSVIVDEITQNEDGTFTVKFKEVRKDPWVLPGEIKSFAGGFAVGRAPIPVPMN